MTELEKQMMENPDIAKASRRAMELSDLMIVAPHKAKYYCRYNIQWLIKQVAEGTPLKYVTFWKADEGEENNIFSQWYKGKPFEINGRSYITAEQYMMSEKALLFNDLDMYSKIMKEPDPYLCKKMGRQVRNFDAYIWNKAFREIIFHGNLGKLQSDIEIVDALLNTGNAVLIEASPYDDIYGAGMKRADLLNSDGTLKTLPQNWHKSGSRRQAENNLGFVLMGIRDLFRDLMGLRDENEQESEEAGGKEKNEVNGLSERLHNAIAIQKISITDLSTDAIVNAANDGLWAGGGVCGAIFKAAGYKKLQAACDAIGHCDTGSAVITPGFDLKAKYIIHAVGPRWIDGKHNEPQLLYNAYKTSLNLAKEYQCHSIGFPLISAGIFGYPLKDAWNIAARACLGFIEQNEDYDLKVVFAVLSDDIIWEGRKQLSLELDERLSFLRFVDQPGQWVDCTPPEVKKRRKKELDELVKMMEEKP